MNKLNVLYIGPYRENSLVGLFSSNILVNLYKNNKLQITNLPIFLTYSIDENIIDSIKQHENKSTNKYDIYIQHTYIDECLAINTIDKNIAIPILKNNNLSRIEINNLKNFHSIIVNSSIDYYKITQYAELKNKVKMFDYDTANISKDVLKNKNKKYNLQQLGFYDNLYFIGSYSNNATTIESLCYSFMDNMLYNKYLLLLFLEINKEESHALNQKIQNIYKENNLKLKTNPIIIISHENNKNNYVMPHLSGNLFVDISFDHGNSLHHKVAKILNKPILCIDKNHFKYLAANNNKYLLSGFTQIDYTEIKSKLRISNILNNNDAVKYQKQLPNISEIV